MTMTKKRLLLFASLPLTIAVTLGVLALLPPRPGVTKANFDRIEMGMTKAEVEEIFGGRFVLHKGMANVGLNPLAGWEAHDGAVALIYLSDGSVVRKDWAESELTFVQKLRRWLHLR
jgi:hypothetical protein